MTSATQKINALRSLATQKQARDNLGRFARQNGTKLLAPTATLRPEVEADDRRIQHSKDARAKTRLRALRELHPKHRDLTLAEFEKKHPTKAKRLLKDLETRRQEEQASKVARGQAKEQAKLAKQAFADAPPEMQQLVKEFGHPAILPPQANSSPYYVNSQIHMDGIGEEHFASIYRHEWGHYLDDKLGGQNGNASDTQEARAARLEDDARITRETLIESASHLVRYAKRTGKTSDEIHADLYAVSDLAGSITRNRVGKGHPDEYYKQESKQGSEAFANMISLIGSGIPEHRKAAEVLAPSLYKYTTELIKNAANPG